MTTQLKPMLNERQAAQFLGVSMRTLQSWRVNGGGCEYTKIGRCVRYSVAKLEHWIEANTLRHTGEVAKNG